MKRIPYIALVLIISCIFVPSVCIAVPLYYMAEGTVTDNQENILPISGFMYIDDQLMSWEEGEGLIIEIPDNEDWSDQTQYYITDFSLMVDDFSFSGNYGQFYLELFKQPNSDELTTGDLMWFLYGDDNSQWDKWIGEHFLFFNDDGTIAEYGNLAELIQLVNLEYNYNDSILSDSPSQFNLMLVRQDLVPIPEPSKAVIFGLFIIVMIAYNKYIGKIKNCV
jgi:hypothetical protein